MDKIEELAKKYIEEFQPLSDGSCARVSILRRAGNQLEGYKECKYELLRLALREMAAHSFREAARMVDCAPISLAGIGKVLDELERKAVSVEEGK